MKDPFSVSLQQTSITAGDALRGEVLLDLDESFEISGIYVQVQGFERVRFRQRAVSNGHGADEDDADIMPKSLHFPTVQVDSDRNTTTITSTSPTRLPIAQPHSSQSALICLTVPVSRWHGTLMPGVHTFPFAVSLPSHLPASLRFASNAKFSAEIAYEVNVQIFRPIANVAPSRRSSISHSAFVPSSSAHRKNSAISLGCPFNLLQKNCIGRSPSSGIFPFLERSLTVEPVIGCCFGSKEVNFLANWPKSTVSPGEAVEINVAFSLSQYGKACALKVVSVKLIRELLLKVNEQSFRHLQPIEKSKFKFPCLQISPDAGLTASTVLNVPRDLVPTTHTTAIDCRYFFIFEIDLKWSDGIFLASEVILLQ